MNPPLVGENSTNAAVPAPVTAPQKTLVLRSAAVYASLRCVTACRKANRPTMAPAHLMTSKIQFAAGSTPPAYVVTARCCPNARRSEEHTSELQSRFDLVCRLLL